MSSLSMVESKLPAGFRFYPKDDELICDYLMNKFAASEHLNNNNKNSAASFLQHSSSSSSAVLIDVDLNKCEPWDLPEVACVGGKEWYFYSQRDRKYATGLRTNRATISGYWKATGKDRPVFRMGRHLVGMRKTLVFYRGRAPKGRKTNWVMHEFRLEGPFGPPKISSSKDDWVLCRVFHKSSEHPSVIKPNINCSPEGVAHHQTSSGCAAHSHSCLDRSGSITLPGLMDSYITFDQRAPIHKTADNNDDNDDDINDVEYNDYSDNKDNIYSNIHNDNNNDSNSQHVPCFSMFSQNLVNSSSSATFSGQLFNNTDLTGGNINNHINNNNVMINSNINPNMVSYNPCSQVNIPSWSTQQLGGVPRSEGGIYQSSTANMIKNSNADDANNPLSACDRSVIRAVLTQLTNKMEMSSQDGANVKGGSSTSVVSLGEAATSSESYLSDVGLPTSTTTNNNTSTAAMWNTHGYLLNKMMN